MVTAMEYPEMLFAVIYGTEKAACQEGVRAGAVVA